MRKYREIKRHLILLGFIFNLLIIFCSNPFAITGNRDNVYNYGDESNLENEQLEISKISGKIYINGTSDWIDFRNSGNCTGQGTFSDPYVIEDLVINGGGKGIWIENSAVYFKIENCTVCNLRDYSGIKLNNISNGILIDNNCSSNFKGIHISNSYNNTISGNTVINNKVFGIVLEECDNNIISSNSVFGINVSSTLPNEGIVLIDSDNNTITDNTVKYHSSKGIVLDKCNSNKVTENNIINNLAGIVLSYSNYSTLLENFIDNSSWYGMAISHSDNNTISRNTITNSYYCGIFLSYSDYNVVSRNNLAGSNNICIKEEFCEGNVFQNNKSCDYGETDQGIPSYNIILLLSIIFILLLFILRKDYKSRKKIWL